jgi:hypothetical protein
VYATTHAKELHFKTEDAIFDLERGLRSASGECCGAVPERSEMIDIRIGTQAGRLWHQDKEPLADNSELLSGPHLI